MASCYFNGFLYGVRSNSHSINKYSISQSLHPRSMKFLVLILPHNHDPLITEDQLKPKEDYKMFAAIATLTIGLRSNGSERTKDIEDVYGITSIEDADETLLDTLLFLKELTGKRIGYVDMCNDHIFKFDVTDAANKEMFVRFAAQVKVDYQLVYDFISERCVILFAVMKDQTDYCCVGGMDANCPEDSTCPQMPALHSHQQ